MKMLEPDYWRGRGRYSKQALSRKIVDESTLHLTEGHGEKTVKK